MKNDTRAKGDIAKKIIKIVLKILYQILIITCVLLIMIIVFQKITDSNRSVGGYRIFRVITGSMEPEYDIGQVVISKEVNPEDIKVGQDIVYFGTYGDYAGKIIMHEVVGIDRDENNNLNFHAKGLHSSSIEDPNIKPSQIYGVVKLKSGLLTVLYKLATSIYSAFIIITVLVLNVFVSFKFTGKPVVQQLEENYEEDEEEDIEEEYIEEDEQEIYEEEIEDIEETEDDESDE